MSIWLWGSVALAGTVRVQSQTPVSVRVDGKVEARLALIATLTDIPAGSHSIEVLDPVGNVLASTSAVVPDGGDPLLFEYYAHRLMPIERKAPPATATPIPDAAMSSLEVHLAKKRSDKKKMKYLTRYYAFYWYEMRHVDSLLLAFASIEDRIEVCELLAPRTLDPENTGAIEDHFPIGEFRERGLAPFAAYKSAHGDDDE